jgi:ABC-type Fe3+-hydroxamate transport system substrate-binding protein
MDLRIVSLVPSLTETVCALGLQDGLVGVTNFCTHPAGLHKSCEIVGGTKDPDIKKIKNLNPSHILVNVEENKPEHIEDLKEMTNVLVTDVRTVDDVPAMFQSLGEFLSCEESSKALAREIKELMTKLDQDPNKVFSALYYIWKDPWMVVSSDSYISSMLRLFGIENIISYDQKQGEKGRYPELTREQLNSLDRDLDLFSTEPWPFRKRDISALLGLIDRKIEPYKVDGKIFSWYGSTTVDALKKAISFRENGLSDFDYLAD